MITKKWGFVQENRRRRLAEILRPEITGPFEAPKSHGGIPPSCISTEQFFWILPVFAGPTTLTPYIPIRDGTEKKPLLKLISISPDLFSIKVISASWAHLSPINLLSQAEPEPTPASPKVEAVPIAAEPRDSQRIAAMQSQVGNWKTSPCLGETWTVGCQIQSAQGSLPRYREYVLRELLQCCWFFAAFLNVAGGMADGFLKWNFYAKNTWKTPSPKFEDRSCKGCAT